MIAKKILNIVAVLTGSLLAFLVAAVIGIQFFIETGTASRLIQDRINAAIPGHISWEKQSLSFLKGQLRIEKVRLQGPDSDDIITADLLAVEVGLKDLLNRELVIRSARIDRPGVFLETTAGGQLNLMRAFVDPARQSAPEPEPDSEPGKSGFNISISELVLSQGFFAYGVVADPSQNRTQNLRLENIGISIADADLGRRSGQLDIEIASGNVDMGGVHAPIRRFRLSTILADGRLDPLDLDIGTADARIRLSGSVAQIFDKPVLDLNLSLAAELSEVRQITQMKAEISGPVQIDMTAAGTLENPDVTMKLNYSGGRLAEMDVQSIDLDCRMKDRSINIAHLDVSAAGGKLEASGLVDLQAAFAEGFLTDPTDLSAIAYRFDLNATAVQLSAFPGMPKASGSLAANLHLAGRGVSAEDLTAEAEVQIHGKRITVDKSIPPIDIDINGRTALSKGTLTMDALSLKTPEAAVEIAGAYQFSENRMNLTANADIPDLAALLAPLGISGVSGKSVKIDADISGPGDYPDVSAEVHAIGLAFREFVIGNLSADIGFEKGRVSIAALDLQNNESRISLAGTVVVLDEKTRQPAADPAMDLALRADPVFLQDFVSGISGKFKVTGNISGSIQHPAGAITAAGRDLDLGGQPISAVDLSSRIKDRKIFIDPLEIFPVPGQGIRAQGWVSLDQTYELNITSDPVAIETINRLAESGLAGRIGISVNGAGRLDNPQLSGQVSLSGLAAGQKTLPDMNISVSLADQALHVDTKDPFAVKVVYDLAGHDFSAAAELAETELAPFFQIAGIRDFSGQVTGMLNAAGNTGNMEQVQAHLKISDLVVLQNETELIRTAGFAVDLENRGITISDSRITFLKEGYLDIRGTAQGTGALDGNLDISADGYFPATLISAMVPGVDQPEGRIRLAANIGGPIKKPDISGNITFESVGLKIVDTMQKLHAVNGQIRITDQAVTVSGLSGRLDAGKFALEGTIDIDRFQPVKANLRFSAQALPVNIDEMLEMQINSDLKLSGTPDKSSLSGNIELLEGNYFKDVNLSLVDTAGEIGKRKRQTAPRPKETGIDQPFLKNLSLDVALTSRNPFVVDNNLALLSIIPGLRIHGDINNPLVSGRAAVADGTLTYRDTEFEVKKGVVDFVNPYRIDPAVDIRAESRVRHWVISLAVSGTLENLEFKFSSNPPEADADILSLLIVGKTTRELAAGSGGDARSPEEMLANLVAGKLAGQVKEETGLDIVEVEYRKNGDAAQDAGEVKVTVGKELSRRITVKYGVENKGGIVVQQSTAIYKLFENLSINAFQDTGGDFGGEMRYRREFR